MSGRLLRTGALASLVGLAIALMTPSPALAQLGWGHPGYYPYGGPYADYGAYYRYGPEIYGRGMNLPPYYGGGGYYGYDDGAGLTTYYAPYGYSYLEYGYDEDGIDEDDWFYDYYEARDWAW